MMNFRTVKESLINNVLGPAAREKFNVVGYQRQTKNANDTTGIKRTAQIFFASSDFLKSAGRLNGPTQNDITFRVELTVSSAAKGDLSVINNPGSTPEQITAAISVFQEASYLVDISFDEFIDEVYQILMSGVNYDLGLEKGVISNRWISSAEKDQPEPRGDLVTLTGSMILTCRTSEEVPSQEFTPGTVHETTIDINGDDVQKTGIEVNSGG